jgi:hypothetical protein
MRIRIAILTVVLVTVLTGALPVLAAADLGAALDYLQSQQNADGGFGSGFSPGSTLGATTPVVLAIIAAGGEPAAFDQDGNTPLTYLEANAPSATSAGDLSKLILAAIAVGENPRSFGGVDSVANLEGLIDAGGRIGGEADTFVSHLMAVLALASAQRPIPASAIEYVADAQQENGSWAWDGSAETAGDTNTTAFAVQALVAAGEAPGSDAIANALAYYQGIQNEDGGWPYQSPSDYGTATDANSTAVTIQAIIAAGQDPAGADWTTESDGTPAAALEALQNPSGAFAWQAAMPDDNLLATVQALPALAGKAFPFATMDVGQVVAVPISVPATGGGAVALGLPLLLSGLSLAASGYLLKRKK